MNKTLNINSFMLSHVNYNFTMPAIEKISVTVNNSIEIKNINGDRAEVKASRLLNFGPGTDSYISVSYLVNISLSDIVDRNDLETIIMENLRKFVSVFSQVSLIISQLTCASPLGTIITPPQCHENNTEIK